MIAAFLATLVILAGMTACFSAGKAGILFGLMLALVGVAEFAQAAEEGHPPLPVITAMTICGVLWTALAWLGLHWGVLIELP